jgi:hypothetical protein
VEALACHSQGVDEASGIAPSLASATAGAGLLGSVLPAAAKAPLLTTRAAAFYRFKSAASKPVVSDGVPVRVTKTTLVGPTG